ncbi:MAG: hypothetical protein AB7U75_09455 [Hyphomicrobiaceae bacterium]
MNKTFALAAAAATLVFANASMASQAEAGGVRLQFGFPLGSFVARPCGSCGSSSSYGHGGHSSYAAERRAAARRAAIAEARREKAEEMRREAIAEAKAEARRENLAAARRLARLKKQRDADDEEEIAKAEIETLAPDAAPLPVRAKAEEAEVAVGEPKVIISNTKSKPAAKQEKVATAAVPAPARPEAPAKPLDCKKFVPSAGLTITVPCQ